MLAPFKGRLTTRLTVLSMAPLPIGICVQPDGDFAWIACQRGEFLAVIDLQTLAMVDRVQARRGPDGMAFASIAAAGP